MKNKIFVAFMAGLLLAGNSGLLGMMTEKEQKERWKKEGIFEGAIENAVQYGDKKYVDKVKKYVKDKKFGIECELLGGTPLQVALDQWKHVRKAANLGIIVWLIENGANVKVEDPDFKTILDKAIYQLYWMSLNKKGFLDSYRDQKKGLDVFSKGLKIIALLISKGLKPTEDSKKYLGLTKKIVFDSERKVSYEANKELDKYLKKWKIKSPLLGKLKKPYIFSKTYKKPKPKKTLLSKKETASLKKKINKIKDIISKKEEYYKVVVRGGVSNSYYGDFFNKLENHRKRGRKIDKDEYDGDLEFLIDNIVKRGKWVTNPNLRRPVKIKLKSEKTIRKELKELEGFKKKLFDLEKELKK
ncbi:hypothetical protein ACFLYU_03845 [Candidatus Dependentiae bacterium]